MYHFVMKMLCEFKKKFIYLLLERLLPLDADELSNSFRLIFGTMFLIFSALGGKMVLIFCPNSGNYTNGNNAYNAK